jgi:hypothetical protein
MMNARSVAAAIPLSLALLASCIRVPDEATSEVSSEVQMPVHPQISDWQLPVTTGLSQDGYLGGEIATLNGVTYLVRSDYCGAWHCSGDYHYIYWSKWTGSGWTYAKIVLDQATGDRVSLAAFNGYLYMLHTGETDSSAVWLSKFDPSTETWSPNFRLNYTTADGPPAMAAFNGQLYLVGITEDCAMWWATLNTQDTPSVAKTLVNHLSCYRPSLAAYDGKLYLVHHAGASVGIQISSRTATTFWTPDKYIATGINHTTLSGYQPVIASVEGYLHLVVRDSAANWMWWTYFDGCKWPSPVTLYNWQSTSRPSLTLGGTGLRLAVTSDVTWNGSVESREISMREFHAPAAPLDPPVCGVGAPP